MNKKFYWLFFCVLIFAQITCGQTQANDAESKSQTKTDGKQRDFPNLKKQAAEVIVALQKGDYDKIVDYTHPKVVEMLGGRDETIAFLKQVMQRMKSEGFEIITVENGEVKQLENVENQLFVVIPTTITMTSPKGKMLVKGYLIGISNEDGENWKFIDAADLDTFKTIFPKAAEKIHLPKQAAPVMMNN